MLISAIVFAGNWISEAGDEYCKILPIQVFTDCLVKSLRENVTKPLSKNWISSAMNLRFNRLCVDCWGNFVDLGIPLSGIFQY